MEEIAQWDSRIVAALIAGSVSLAVAFFANALTFWKLADERKNTKVTLEIERGKLNHARELFEGEREKWAQEADARRKETNIAIDALRQGLYDAILPRRADAYQALYAAYQRGYQTPIRQGAKVDLALLRALANEIEELNAVHGVFFYDGVYWLEVTHKSCGELIHPQDLVLPEKT